PLTFCLYGLSCTSFRFLFFFFQAEDGIRDRTVTGVQTCALPIYRSIQLALDVRREVNSHPLVSKYFHVLGADEMIPAEFRTSGFIDYLTPGTNWAKAVEALKIGRASCRERVKIMVSAVQCTKKSG